MTKLALALIVPALALAACGSDPVSFSQPVGINLKAKSGDVTNTAISETKDITTETSNPYGAFITDARGKLGGKDPSTIEVSNCTLTLGGTSTNVATLDQVFTGDVDVAFITNDSNNTYDVAHVTSPTGAGPDTMSVVFDYSTVSSVDVPKFLNGSFKVVVRGPAATDFAGKGAEADLQVTFTFDALE